MRLIIALLFLFIVSNVYAADVVICQTSNDDNKQIVSYLKSVHTPSYNLDPKNIINPDLSSLSPVPLKYWKCASGNVVEMTALEKSAIDQAETDAENQATQARINEVDVSLKDAFTAFIKVYNSKVPLANRITKQELIDQIKLDKGL